MSVSSLPSVCNLPLGFVFFFFNDTATTEIYTLSLHDALPISNDPAFVAFNWKVSWIAVGVMRSEEHTSELQSPCNLVCRLLLEKINRVSYETGCRRSSGIFGCSTACRCSR